MKLPRVRFTLRRLMLVVAAIAFASWIAVSQIRNWEYERYVDSCLAALPDWQSYPKSYRADPFIQTAVALQGMGRKRAIRRLRALRGASHADNAIVLCRLLFARSDGHDFRAPLLGAPSFFGGSSVMDWPNCPIEIVNGVPFLITWGYQLHGQSEPLDSYLTYCENHCEWRRETFALCNDADKRGALEKLLVSTKWKVALHANDREFFQSQIR
jgi:hypothetical protein